MSAATTNASVQPPPPRAQVGEWFWRFLAVVMLFVVAWVVWIAIQISPPDMVLPAAYEAAAQGRARNSGGVIGSPAVPASAVPDSKEAAAVAPATPATASVEPAPVPPVVVAAPVEPPVNLEKLRRADSIETPVVERPRRAARSAADSKQ